MMSSSWSSLSLVYPLQLQEEDSIEDASSSEKALTLEDCVALAAELSAVDWELRGIKANTSTPTQVLVERVTALLLIRLVAIAAAKQQNVVFSDYSSSTIAANHPDWPEPFTTSAKNTVLLQLQSLVRKILSCYNTPETGVYFHTAQKACHNVLLVNKLLDMMWLLCRMVLCKLQCRLCRMPPV